MRIECADAPEEGERFMLTTIPRCPIDLDDPAFLSGDRSAAYQTMLTESPIARAEMGGHEVFLASRHADVAAISRLSDSRVRPLGELAPAWMGSGPTSERLRANLAQTDAPVHTSFDRSSGRCSFRAASRSFAKCPPNLSIARWTR
ncbi:hypothetical protein BJF84_21520 [Rhodococcus sp. CUA-806]|nr:hypothetical protein BJF84_21520 [Rhodococcus sp. CUA-806]